MKILVQVVVEVIDKDDAPLMLLSHVGTVGDAEMAVTPQMTVWRITGPDKIATFNVEKAIMVAAEAVQPFKPKKDAG